MDQAKFVKDSFEKLFNGRLLQILPSTFLDT